jgi:predicted RNase H-like HicB family nuclease
MHYHLECEQEEDGRWIAEVADLPGVLSYGATRDEAMRRAETLALRAIAEQLEAGEAAPTPIHIALPEAA